MATRTAAILLTLGLVLGVAACSDDGGDAISKEDYLDQAGAICDETRATIEEAAADLDPDNPNALGEYVSYVSAEVLEELDRLRDLGYPEDAREELAAAYDVYEARFTEWRDDPSLVEQGAADPEVIAAGETLADYGLPACGADL